MTLSDEQELVHLQNQNLLRSLRTWQTAPSPLLTSLQNESYINFSSNDYLGLSQHSTLKEAAIKATQNSGTGATASRLVCGTFDCHRELEQRIAALKESDDARVFANGYCTAMGTITALVGKGDTIILDKLSHACLIDASKLSGAQVRVFPHNNLDRLESILRTTREKSAKARILVITESVFSMDGDCCPLLEIIALKNKYEASLLLDEAHALGVLGERGLGLAEQLGVQQDVDLQMGTLGKAAGSAGGYLAANQTIIDLLTNKARSFIYSTAPPPAQIAASLAALNLIVSEEGAKLRTRLFENANAVAIPSPERLSPIIPLILGENEKALQASEKLSAKGLLVPAIRFPTVPKGTARLRITVSAAHTEEHLQKLNQILCEITG